MVRTEYEEVAVEDDSVRCSTGGDFVDDEDEEEAYADSDFLEDMDGNRTLAG